MYPFLIKFLSLYLDIPVLVYHSVKNNKILLFKKQLEFLKKNSFEVLNPYDFILRLSQPLKKSKNHSILLTFDDGYKDFFFNVFPLLLEYKFPALIFLIVNNIGKLDYLNFEEIKDMLASGIVYIGSHTLSHQFLPKLKREEQEIEIKESKRILEEKLSIRVDFFSYPWGGFNEVVRKQVKDAGYFCAFTTNQAISKNINHGDIFAIKRLTIREDESDLRFFLKVSGLAYLFQKKIKNG